jgi:hypothetical protein
MVVNNETGFEFSWVMVTDQHGNNSIACFNKIGNQLATVLYLQDTWIASIYSPQLRKKAVYFADSAHNAMMLTEQYLNSQGVMYGNS